MAACAPVAQLDRAPGFEPVPDSPETSINPGFVGENAVPQRTPGDRKGLSGTEMAGSTAGSTSREFVGHDPGQNPPSPSRASASWDGAASRSRIGSCLPVRSRLSRPRLFHASWFCSARIVSCRPARHTALVHPKVLRRPPAGSGRKHSPRCRGRRPRRLRPRPCGGRPDDANVPELHGRGRRRSP